ncbi:MAG: MFS transporter [Acidimicrobiales bacterium]
MPRPGPPTRSRQCSSTGVGDALVEATPPAGSDLPGSTAGPARRCGPAGPPTPGVVLATLCMAFFMVILDTTIVNVALPAMQTSLHTSVTGLQWVVDGYALVFAALLLGAGSSCDRVGAKAVFVVGLVAFTAGSAWCALAPGLAWLVGGRLIEGLGAAMVLPASLALIAANFAEPARRARAVGVWAAVAGAATAIGPVAGGLLVDTAGWRSIFLVNIPLGMIGLVLAWRYLADTPRRPGTHDLPGQLLAIASLGALTFALVEAGSLGWGSAVVLAAGLGGLALGAGFVRREIKATQPMLPVALFANRTFSGANAVGAVLNFGIYGQVFVLSLYFQHLRGYTALATGLALLPFAAMTVAGPVLVGRLTARVGPRLPMVAGQALAAGGSAVLALAGAHSAYSLLVPGLVALGAGMALTMPSMTAAVVAAAPPGSAGAASGVLNTARQVGGALGVALLGSLVARQAGFLAGLHAGLGLVAAAFAAGAFLAVLYIERPATSSPAAPTHQQAA